MTLFLVVQAFLNKYYGGRNALIFAPAELRDLSESHEATEPRFADLSGLGKIVISNIRTPKMLMDVSSMQSKGAADNGKDAIEHLQGSEGKTRPLEQVGNCYEQLQVLCSSKS